MIGTEQPHPSAARTSLAGRVLADAAAIDRAVYAAIARTETPTLDLAMRRLSDAADHSKLSLGAATLLVFCGGARGRRAAVCGLGSLAATQAVVNAVVKPLGRRRRPDRTGEEVPLDRRVRMPGSGSFPSGHTSGAVAFAHGVARVMPSAGVPLHALAVLVGYSRVHTGVHYPGDVLGGAVLATMIADATAAVMARKAGDAVRPPFPPPTGRAHSSASKS